MTFTGLLLAPEMKSMNDKCFVDTNILIYAHDRTAGTKHRRAQALVENLWESGRGALSTQVLQELCANLRRKVAHPVSPEELRVLIRDYSAWEIVVNTASSILNALEIEQRYNTSFWDALVIQAAESCGASILYSEDLAVGQRHGTVQIVNPLI